MGEYFEALVLGIVQGLTEFLPVSSSGHLEIMKYLLDDDSLAQQSMMTTVFLHFATALSTIFVFRKDIIDIIKGVLDSNDKESKPFVFYIIVSMIPAAFIGVFFDDILESLFHKKIALVASMLLMTGIILLLSEWIKTKDRKINIMNAVVIGIAQAIAIMPGISRSGATIGTALMLGVDREKAARFSFLMVIPLIFGKIAKDLLSGELLAAMPSVSYLIIGFLGAFLTGVFACSFMINVVKRAQLSWFALYCFLVGGAILLYITLT